MLIKRKKLFTYKTVVSELDVMFNPEQVFYMVVIDDIPLGNPIYYKQDAERIVEFLNTVDYPTLMADKVLFRRR